MTDDLGEVLWSIDSPDRHFAFKFIPAGHILGAASMVFRARDSTFFYTGDISNFRQRAIDGIKMSELSGIDVDLMWCEATYGDTEHPARRAEEKRLAKAVEAGY